MMIFIIVTVLAQAVNLIGWRARCLIINSRRLGNPYSSVDILKSEDLL